MRELAKCIAWTVGLGALALGVAAFASVGLAQAEGVGAWIVLAVYSPFYLLGHAFSADAPNGLPDSALDAAVFASQFAYFFVVVAGTRYLYRRRRGRRPVRAL